MTGNVATTGCAKRRSGACLSYRVGRGPSGEGSWAVLKEGDILVSIATPPPADRARP